ncbi:ABC transporter permease [Cumulibacter soli]|uniref:ABC transporter permease n=1 Tax=Cumulibacter soli TaxID=2546344 RepID=UPI001067217C|nr:ABC transporter permease [Cumulibacter soli]
MAGTLLRRFVPVIPTLFIASVVVFLLVQFVPGDPAVAIAGESATPEIIAALREQMGLEKPLIVQYWDWLMSLLGGDLGNSFLTGESVNVAIGRTIFITVSVVALALVFSLVIGIPAGLIAGAYARRAADRTVSTLVSVLMAMPTFWFGLVLVSLFAVQGNMLPATGYVPISQSPVDYLRHLILPSFAMGIVGACEIARQLRSAMIEALNSDYVRTLYAKGLSRSRVIRHALKNSGVPLLTIVGLQINRFLGATVVIDTIFGLGGLGSLIMGATLKKDMVVIQGVVLVMAVIVIMTNVIVDLSYRLVDPRIR